MNDIKRYKNKKLLILAGAAVHCKVVEAAKDLGVYTIVTDYLKDSPAKKIADESLMYDIFDIESIEEYCKKNNVNGVIGYCIDPTQVPAQELAERLGLKSYGNKEQTYILTNKRAFKNTCKKYGVDTIKEYSIDEIENDNHVEYPLLVKPDDSRGSRGISVCNNKKECLEAITIAKKESSTGNVIIEKYMSNNMDITISYLIKNGKCYLYSIGDRYPGRIEDNLNRQNSCVIQPSKYADMFINKVNQRIIKMIKGIGIKNGNVFFQGFVDGETVRLYDPGIRVPGNEYERLFEKATGLNPMKSVIPYILGDEIDDCDGKYEGSYNLNNHRVAQYMINVGPGEIAKYEGLKKIKEHPNVIDVVQKHFVGDKIENTGDIKHRAGEISILCSRDKDELIETIKYIQNNLYIEDIYGNNMIISAFDINRINENY